MFLFGDQNWRTVNSLSIENIHQAINTKDYKIIQDNDEATVNYFLCKPVHFIFLVDTNA